MRKEILTLTVAVVLFAAPVRMAISQEGEMHKPPSGVHGMVMGGGMGMGMMCPMMGMIGGMAGADPTRMEMRGEMMIKMGEMILNHSSSDFCLL